MFNFFKKTKEEAKVALVETKEKVDKLAINADKFLDDSNNQIKTITLVIFTVGATLIISNIINVGTNIYMARQSKQPKVINNIYINKESIKK